MSTPRRVRVPGPFRRAELPKGTTYVGRGVLGYPRSPFNNPFPVPKKGQVAEVEVDGVTSGYATGPTRLSCTALPAPASRTPRADPQGTGWSRPRLLVQAG
jgi:hypothetical protein